MKMYEVIMLMFMASTLTLKFIDVLNNILHRKK